MPDNTLAPDCLHGIGEAQLFMSPTRTPDQKGVKEHVVAVLVLALATGYSKDPEGRLLTRAEKAGALPNGERKSDTTYRKPLDAVRPRHTPSDGGSPRQSP